MRPVMQRISALRAWSLGPLHSSLSSAPAGHAAPLPASRQPVAPAVCSKLAAGTLISVVAASSAPLARKQAGVMAFQFQALSNKRFFCAEAEDNEELKEKYKELLERIESHNLPPREDLFRYLEQCNSKKDLKRALVLLDRYKPWMDVKSVRAGALILRAAVRAQEYDTAMKIVKDHRQMRLQLSTSAGRDLLDALAAAGEIDKMQQAYKILEKLTPAIAKPTTLISLIRGLLKNGECDKAVDLLEEWRAKGVVPKPVSYKVLLQGFNTSLEESEEGESRENLLKSRDRVKTALQKDNLLKDAAILQLLQYVPPAQAAEASTEGDGDAAAEEKKEEAKA